MTIKEAKEYYSKKLNTQIEKISVKDGCLTVEVDIGEVVDCELDFLKEKFSCVRCTQTLCLYVNNDEGILLIRYLLNHYYTIQF